MNQKIPVAILSAAMLATRAICQAQVYSQNTLPIPHQADEVSLCSWSVAGGNNVTSTAGWYVSTNVLAKQPHWDPLSAEPSVSVHQACSRALTNLVTKFPEIRSWSVTNVQLFNPYNHGVGPLGSYYSWYYMITFNSNDPKRHRGFDNDFDFHLTQIVLLDGTVVQPRIVTGK